MKLKEIMAEVKSGRVFGEYQPHLGVVEFHKRGLTNSMRLADGCGREFQTQVLLTAFLEQKKLKYMIRKPCGANNVNASCTQLDREDTNRKRCDKHFPQPFRSNATMNGKPGRVEHTRVKSTNDRPPATNFVDGRWTNVPVGDEQVASYNPYLLPGNAIRFPYSCWRRMNDCNCLRKTSLQICAQRRGLRQSKNPRDNWRDRIV